jgi:hypothetical protein
MESGGGEGRGGVDRGTDEEGEVFVVSIGKET